MIFEQKYLILEKSTHVINTMANPIVTPRPNYGIRDEPWVPDWFVSCETDTWEYRLSRIRIDIDYGIRDEPGLIHV